MENFQEKIQRTFVTTPAGRIQGRGRDPLKISKGNKFLGAKTNRKFLGRGRSGRNKIKSKRRNNFKTYEARKILASRHGIANALKKEDNKYVLTYGDIARLMRQNNYTYSQELRRWMDKEKKDDEEEKDDKKDPYVNRPQASKSAEPSKVKSDEIQDKEDEENDVVDDSDSLNTPPIDFNPIKKKKPISKDKLKNLQARIILIANDEPSYGEYEIVPDDIEFKISDDDVKKRMGDKELLWLKNKNKWVDYKGKDPNPLEKYKGTLGRAILVDSGEYNFLNFEEGNIDDVSDKLLDMGFEYIDGDWVDTEEKMPIEEAAGTSSAPANAGVGANSQGISPFMSRLGAKINKRLKPESVVI